MAGALHRSLVPALALAWAWSAAAADRAGYAVAEPPDWVEPYTLERADFEMKEAGGDGARYLLSDSQERWDGRISEFYYRLVAQVSEPDALSEIGNIQISFDPSFQRLTIHAISITRGDETLDKLANARFDLLRREESLERRLLDGHRTVAIEIEDLRVGDLVDYSYTITSDRLVLQGHYFSTFRLEYGVPVGAIRVRLTVPEGKRLNVSDLNGRLEPAVTTRAGESTYEWLQRKTQGFDSLGDTPDWYLGGRAVQLSTFRSWREVIEFEMPFYSVPETLSPELRAEIDQIAREHSDPKARLREILDRIQSKIRYLGIELGDGGYVPRDPSLVLKQRFGDCKDMSLLMVTMARALGISAYPAIVDTNKRIGRNRIVPTAGYFNHVIVLARIGGESYWLDPTRTLQSGTVDHVFQPDFGEALVLEPGAVDLVEMKQHDSREPTIEIDESFDLAASFARSPADYRVTTRYHSYRADLIRESLRTDGIEDLQKRFVNFYKRIFPALAVAETMDIVDDIDANIVTVREHYSIDDAWRWDAGKQLFEFAIAPYDVESELEKPSVVDRSAPYGRPHPVHVRQTTTVILPFSAPIDEHAIEIEHPAFRFTKQTSHDDSANATTMAYEYMSKADAVSADDLQTYLVKIKEAEDLTWYWARTDHLSERGEADLANYEEWLGLWVLGCVILVPVGWFLYRQFRPVSIPPGTQYYPIRRGKLLAMSVLTFGLYPIYWAYRNWLSIKVRDASRVAPKLFGLFFPISYFWLLRDVNRSAAGCGQTPVRVPALWAVALLACESAGFLDPPTFFAEHLAAVATLTYSLGLNLLMFACLLPCVDLIGRLNQRAPAGLRQNSRFGIESWIVVLICIPMGLFAIDLNRPTKDISDVAPAVADYLEELELLDADEIVENFRAPSDFHYRRGGSVITNRKVLRYWTSDDLSYWYSEKAAYDDIASMTFENDPDLGVTQARFVRRQGDDVNLVLPEAEGEVLDVIRRLVERSPSAEVTYDGIDPIGGEDAEER